MTDAQILKWIKDNKLKPERAAAIFDVSTSSIYVAKRGAGFSEDLRDKIVAAIQRYSAKDQQTRKAG